MFSQVEAAAKEKGVELKLVEGKGDDPDTLGKKIVWVMDTAKFPFYQGTLLYMWLLYIVSSHLTRPFLYDTLDRLILIIIHHLFVTLLAELYHQYHDGFMLGEQYPESYNALAKKAFAQGRLQKTGCPDTNF